MGQFGYVFGVTEMLLHLFYEQGACLMGCLFGIFLVDKKYSIGRAM